MRQVGAMLAVVIAMWLCGAPAHAAWNEARSRHFIVYSDGSAKQLQTFTARLEKFDFLLRKLTDTLDDEPGAPVVVYTLPNAGSVARLTGRDNLAGYYRQTQRNGYAVVGRERKDGQFDLGAEEIFFHEYAHHFMLHYFPVAYPAWYVEGFAEFYSVIKFKPDDTIEFGYPPLYRAYGLVSMQPLPVAQLFAGQTERMNAMTVDRFYGTAWLLTHMFRYKTARGDEFHKYLEETVAGKGKDAESYFAGGFKALDKELRAYMTSRMSISRMTPREVPDFPVTVAPVEPGQAAMMMLTLRSMQPMDSDGLARLAQEIRATAAQHPQSSYAQTLLAEVEQAAGQPDAALAAADRAIALDPKNARAFGTKADILLDRAAGTDDAAKWRAALTAIVQGNKADTEDAVPLFQFYRYHQMRGGTMPQIAYDGLNKAFALVPQHSGYRFTLAMSYADRKKFAVAARLLDPIAFSPHASPARDGALRLREALLRAETTGRLEQPIDIETVRLEE
ncbi:hypothetical protein ENE74_01040 [Sphingobium algorifonticola]|uniref:DUF1570 domain-containing protein n=2 Tax=Sphingobium algorifonticola TaxID=2008318 RepID=A0A437JDF9_9SPHN|nr:hypothetical protein ENE74_01040 [Sphingobium algorifonticola]